MGYGYGSGYGTVNDLLFSGNSIYAATNYGIYECKLPTGGASESGTQVDVALADGIDPESIKLFRTSDESGLELTCGQSGSGTDFIDFTIEVPMDEICTITAYSASGTEIPLMEGIEMDTGTYTLKVYNKT